MKHVLLCITVLACLSACPAQAQTFQECADINGGGTLNISDLVSMIEIFKGNIPLPPGKGDIDLRQGFNLGDLRYFSGYVFMAYPEGGCPPFSPYTLVSSPDTLFLPSSTVAAGSGSVTMSIVMLSHEPISELLITGQLTTSGVSATISSIEFVNWVPQIHTGDINDSNATLLWATGTTEESLNPGAQTIARLHVNYTSAGGGTISFESANLGPYRFTHQVFGQISEGNPNTMQIGTPNIFVTDNPGLAQLIVSPDTLSFLTLVDWPDPDPQSFTIDSDGPTFAWTLTHPSWLDVSPTSGFAGATVSVQPLITGMAVGVYYADVVVTAEPAYDSPQTLTVKLTLRQQYPSFDANCDGTFNISDIIVLIMYIFGGPAPCDPCS